MMSPSIQVHSLNSTMILQRLPRGQVLKIKDMEKLESANQAAITEAKDSLNLEQDGIKVCDISLAQASCTENPVNKQVERVEIPNLVDKIENKQWGDTDWPEKPGLNGIKM